MNRLYKWISTDFTTGSSCFRVCILTILSCINQIWIVQFIQWLAGWRCIEHQHWHEHRHGMAYISKSNMQATFCVYISWKTTRIVTKHFTISYYMPMLLLYLYGIVAPRNHRKNFSIAWLPPSPIVLHHVHCELLFGFLSFIYTTKTSVCLFLIWLEHLLPLSNHRPPAQLKQIYDLCPLPICWLTSKHQVQSMVSTLDATWNSFDLVGLVPSTALSSALWYDYKWSTSEYHRIQCSTKYPIYDKWSFFSASSTRRNGLVDFHLESLILRSVFFSSSSKQNKHQTWFIARESFFFFFHISAIPF